MKSTLWKYGLIGGIVMSLLFAASVLLAGDPNNYGTMEIIGYASILLALLAVFFGIKSYRDRELGGRITFGKGVLTGIGISAIAGVILGLYTFIHIAWLDPDFVKEYTAWERQRIEASSATPQEKAEQIKKIEEMPEFISSPGGQGLFMVVTVFSIGVVVSLLCAAILKRGGGGSTEVVTAA